MVRTFIPKKKLNENSEDESLISQKQAKKLSTQLLDIFEECLSGKLSQISSNGKAPMLKKREIEDLESENTSLKQRLIALADMNKELLKRVKGEQEE